MQRVRGLNSGRQMARVPAAEKRQQIYDSRRGGDAGNENGCLHAWEVELRRSRKWNKRQLCQQRRSEDDSERGEKCKLRETCRGRRSSSPHCASEANSRVRVVTLCQTTPGGSSATISSRIGPPFRPPSRGRQAWIVTSRSVESGRIIRKTIQERSPGRRWRQDFPNAAVVPSRTRMVRTPGGPRGSPLPPSRRFGAMEEKGRGLRARPHYRKSESPRPAGTVSRPASGRSLLGFRLMT